MNWFVDTRSLTRGDPRQIGPGRLILVVGPSGAGKDTLIHGVRARCAGDLNVVFPRRAVTRPAGAAEDNDCLTIEAFDRAAAQGSFALWWAAHGHKYGIPITIDADLRAGRAVICNVSRTVVAEARRRYRDVAVVLVTAPPGVLAARLSARRRDSDGDLALRLRRAPEAMPDADCVIDNTGHPDAGIRRLMNVVRDHGFFLIS